MREKINIITDKIQENKVWKSVLIAIILLGLSAMIMVITFVLSSATWNVELYNSYFKSPLLMLLNFIPIIFIMGLVYLLFNKLWLGYSISALLFVVMAIVNKTKLTYRDDPFVFIDLKLVGESIKMAGRYDVKIGPRLFTTIIGLILIAIILKIFFDFKLESKKIRLTFALILISAGILSSGVYSDTEVYAKVGDESKINGWIYSQRFQSKGFIYSFLHSVRDGMERVPEGYSEDNVKDLLSEYTYKDIEEDKKINLVTIMLEAYNDFSKFDTVELNEDIYEYFHELQEESITGRLLTNVFAGGTIDTERGFLTGYHNHPSYKGLTNSFVWYMHEQGYKTEAMHPITGSFYDRRNGNEYIGFENFDYYENKYEAIQEEPLMDMAFFEYIIQGYEDSISEGRPYFHYTITYQNHGPYSDEKAREEEYLNRKPEYGESDYNIVNNYLYGIYETTQALEKLVNHFKESEEPVVLVLFGDHNPWLGKDNSCYNMLNIDMDLATSDGFKNYYEIPYIIWANEKAKEVTANDFKGEGVSLSPNNLMAEVFENIGWEGNEYMQYIKDFKREIPVNHNLYFNEDGEYVPSSDLSSHTQNLWDDFVKVEYYMKKNFIER